MGLPSKEAQVLGLFFNEPSKHWHFEEIIRTAKISRSQANHWLKKLVKNKIISYNKPRRKFSYFISNVSHPNYKTSKKVFALNTFQDSGFMEHLASLEKAKAIIIFGSFSRSDWYAESDIDIFIYGNAKDFKIGKFELKLHRDIQLFEFETLAELKKTAPNLIPHIFKGILVKGELDFIEVNINDKKAHA